MPIVTRKEEKCKCREQEVHKSRDKHPGCMHLFLRPGLEYHGCKCSKEHCGGDTGGGAGQSAGKCTMKPISCTARLTPVTRA